MLKPAQLLDIVSFTCPSHLFLPVKFMAPYYWDGTSYNKSLFWVRNPAISPLQAIELGLSGPPHVVRLSLTHPGAQLTLSSLISGSIRSETLPEPTSRIPSKTPGRPINTALGPTEEEQNVKPASVISSLPTSSAKRAQGPRFAGGCEA